MTKMIQIKIATKKRRKMEIIYSNLSFTKVTQNLENLKSNFNFPKRSYEHKYKSNNWIKMHGKAMRRKPFKKVNAVVMMDEFWNIR